jgi:NADPH-dependent ferric siderophore reductase
MPSRERSMIWTTVSKGDKSVNLRHKILAYKDWLRRQEPHVAERALACLRQEEVPAMDQWQWIAAVTDVIAERRNAFKYGDQ